MSTTTIHKTEIGTVEVVVTDRNHIYIYANGPFNVPEKADRFVTLNKVDYSFNVHLFRQPAGYFEIHDPNDKNDNNDYHLMYGTRMNWAIENISYDKAQMSCSARDKAKEFFTNFANKYACENPKVFEEAEIESRREEVTRYENEIKELEGKISELRKKIFDITYK